jgi:DNA gyrase/topoisomerase IV subunit B
MGNNLYDEKSIESLSPLEFTRLRPGVYAGDTTYSTQLLVEIVSNAVDEFRLGHGEKIDVDIDKNIVTVRDYGQGFIPNSFREDGKTILEAAFSVLNTSGKYREDGTYEGTSLGSFGIGSKITTFLSHWLVVETRRDGKYEKVVFKEGVFEDRFTGPCEKESGTIVTWEPSEEFFTYTEVEIDKIKTLFDTITCLCPGLTIHLTYNGNEITFFSKNGLNDLVDKMVGSKEIINNRFNMYFSEGKEKLDFILTYTSNYSSTIVPYVNTGLTEKGPHITQIKTLLTREFNKFFREKKWLKDKDENLTGDDIQEGMYVVFNITAPNVGYDAQVKSTITKIEMKPFLQSISVNLQVWLNNNEKEIKIIADKAISARKAREAAKKAREAVRAIKPKTKGLKAKMALSNKFIDCANKNPKERNLLLVEGLSAGSSAVEARNEKTDCIYMLRGKIISPLKTSIDKILANQEMADIIKVIGAGFGNDNFDINKMNFDKIVITTDADSDGADIELLLITFFFTYMRPLVEAGKLYRAVTPLYIVKTSKEELYFYTEEEMEKYKTTHKSGYDVLRAKGLGELNAKDLHKVCFKDQRFKRITISDAEATERLLEVLQGQAVTPRKQFIYDNAEKLGFNFD